MTLFSTIQLASNALRAQQIGLQVAGQNIANTNTPGYIREEVILSPAPTQKIGAILLGMGVQVTGVVQIIDQFLEERLRGAAADSAGADVQKESYLQLESVLGELSDTDLSSALDKFFASINEIVNQPENVSIRNLAVLEGKQTIADEIVRQRTRVLSMRDDLDARIGAVADDINRLINDIATLNRRIAEVEGGGTTASDAVGLRDQRQVALAELAELVGTKAIEQPDGTVSVFAGGDFIVFRNEVRTVEAVVKSVNGLQTTSIELVHSRSELEHNSGKVAGLTAARDDIMGNYLNQLDAFAGTLIFEFNKMFSSGHGLRGHQDITSERSVVNSSAALDAAGLSFTAVDGSFEIKTFSKDKPNLIKTTVIDVDLDGLNNDDTTLIGLTSQINAINGVTATITAQGRLSIVSDSSENEFVFNNDTSGLLAALGINTFFTGSSAADMDVNDVVLADASKFSSGSFDQNGVRHEDAIVLQLANFIDRPLETAADASLKDLYDRLTNETTQGSSVAGSVANGFDVFEETLRAQKLGISGVSLDEEAVRMITFQRAFQANARVIATINELMDVLVNL